MWIEVDICASKQDLRKKMKSSFCKFDNFMTKNINIYDTKLIDYKKYFIVHLIILICTMSYGESVLILKMLF